MPDLIQRLIDMEAEIDKQTVINQIQASKNKACVLSLCKRHVKFKRLEEIAVEMNDPTALPKKELTCGYTCGIMSVTCERAFFIAHFFPRLRVKICVVNIDRQGGSRLSATGKANIRRCRLMRVKVTLRCNECKQRNYNTMKNKKNTPDKLELNKYCRFCRKHTLHSETK